MSKAISESRINIMFRAHDIGRFPQTDSSGLTRASRDRMGSPTSSCGDASPGEKVASRFPDWRPLFAARRLEHMYCRPALDCIALD